MKGTSAGRSVEAYHPGEETLPGMVFNLQMTALMDNIFKDMIPYFSPDFVEWFLWKLFPVH